MIQKKRFVRIILACFGFAVYGAVGIFAAELVLTTPGGNSYSAAGTGGDSYGTSPDYGNTYGETWDSGTANNAGTGYDNSCTGYDSGEDGASQQGYSGGALIGYGVSDGSGIGNTGTGSSLSEDGTSGSDSYSGSWQAQDSSQETEAPSWQDPNEESWCLILVNRDNPIPAGYTIPELTYLTGGNAVDSRIYPALQAMFDDARADYCLPYITSSYRTYEEQQAEMDARVQEYLWYGNTEEEAHRLAEEWVAIPGTSEHQLGLAVDISTDNTVQVPWTVWNWLLENSWKYGFVQRYPEDKIEITGIETEPWHFRYVGLKAARAMHQSGQCLEEYLQTRNSWW